MSLASELPQKSWDTAELVAFIKAQELVCRRHREPFLKLFRQALRFWAGDQWPEVTSWLGSEMRRPPREEAQDFRLVDNQIPIYARHLLAVAMTNMPRLRAVPVDPNDQEDVFSAELATAYLAQRERADNEATLREAEWLWLIGVGELLRLTYFDAHGGDPLLGDGDVVTQVVDPFRYIKDPYSIGRWPPRFLILSEARHVDWIKEHFGVTVQPESVADEALYYDDLAMNVMWGYRRQSREVQKNAAIISQFWIPPCVKYPEGWLYVRIGENLVRSNPLQAGMWPFAMAGWYPFPARLYNIGLVELIMHDQRHLNQMVSTLHEAATKQARGDRTVSGAMGADGRSIRQFVHDPKTQAKTTVYPPGVQDMPTNYGADWQQAEVRRSNIDRAIHQKAGVNQPSLGQTLERETRVGELMLAREGDMQIQEWHLRRYAEQCATHVAMQKVRLAQEYVLLPRQLEGVGPNGELAYFQGADLKGVKDVIAVTLPHMSPAMKQQLRMQIYADRLCGPYESLEQQVSARKLLIELGMDSLEKELSKLYGPLSEVEELARQVIAMKYQAEFNAAQMAAQMAAMGPAATQGAAEQEVVA